MKFNRKNLKIKDNWSVKEIGPKGSDEVWFFRKNLGASQIQGHPDLKHQVYLTISYTPVPPRGLPCEADLKVLYDFEEIDIPAIEIDSDSIYVASVFKGGVKDHIFYTGDPDAFLIAANQRRSRLQGFKVALECNDDLDWSVYKDFP